MLITAVKQTMETNTISKTCWAINPLLIRKIIPTTNIRICSKIPVLPQNQVLMTFRRLTCSLWQRAASPLFTSIPIATRTSQPSTKCPINKSILKCTIKTMNLTPYLTYSTSQHHTKTCQLLPAASLSLPCPITTLPLNSARHASRRRIPGRGLELVVPPTQLPLMVTGRVRTTRCRATPRAATIITRASHIWRGRLWGEGRGRCTGGWTRKSWSEDVYQ